MSEPIMSSMEAIDKLLRAWDLEVVPDVLSDGSGKKNIVHVPTGRKLVVQWRPEDGVPEVTDPEVIMFRELSAMIFELLTRPQEEEA
jgi:hypothetical protein